MQAQSVQSHRRPVRRAIPTYLFMAAMLVFITLLPSRSQAATGPGLVNGSFEVGFVRQQQCHWRSDLYEVNVGAGWKCFNNRGLAHYGFYADAWSPVVADGQYSQLIEINTWGLENGDNDRYAGIYQTVSTLPGAIYRLSMRGMIRTTNLDGDEWRYQVQVGYLPGPDRDWRDVSNWTDVGWYTYYPRTEPGAFSEYEAILRPQTEHFTIFIRVWKKWGVPEEELDVNLDMIRLVRLTAPHGK